jgi:hypothetical protein
MAETNYRVLAVAWVGVATLVRFASVANLPLGNGESYYYSWSRFLDWSYYDHPPLIAWLVRLTTALGVSPGTVRLGPVLAAGAFGLLFYRLAERFVRPRAAFFGLVLVTALPAFLASSFIVNPEASLAPLWVGFLLCVERMRKEDERFLPLLAGVLLGFAFLAKYTAVLLVVAAFLYFGASPLARRWLRRPSFYVGGAIALTIALPVLVWNATRGWPSVRLHLLERASATAPVAGENTISHLVAVASSNGASPVQTVLRVLVGQLMAYSPLLAPLLVLALVRSLRRIRNDDGDLFLTAFSWPVLLPLLAAMTRFQDAEQHWTMMAYVPAAVAAGRYVDDAWSGPHARARRARVRTETRTGARSVRILAAGGVVLSALAFVLANVHARTTALLRLFPHDHYDARADMINELVGWDELRASVARALASARSPVVLAGNQYALCGRLLFETEDSPPVYCPTAKRSAFDFFDRREPPPGATVVVVTSDIHPELPAELRGGSCAPADEVVVERDGRNVARYFVRSCSSAWVDHGRDVAQIGRR